MREKQQGHPDTFLMIKAVILKSKRNQFKNKKVIELIKQALSLKRLK